MASADRIIEGFPYQTITPVVGQICFETITLIGFFLSNNAESIISHHGNGTLGLLWFTVSDAVYNTLFLVPFIPPLNTGTIPVVPAGSIQFQINSIADLHKREAATFKDFGNTDQVF